VILVHPEWPSEAGEESVSALGAAVATACPPEAGELSEMEEERPQLVQTLAPLAALYSKRIKKGYEKMILVITKIM